MLLEVMLAGGAVVRDGLRGSSPPGGLLQRLLQLQAVNKKLLIETTHISGQPKQHAG